MIRKIIHIDEEKCNGCGLCATACHEGAIDIINGKAKLVRENFCDGFGDCLRRIFAAQSGQYFARLLPAANVLPHTAQRFKSVSPLRVICSQSCLSAGNTASRK